MYLISFNLLKHLACLHLCDDHHAPINKLISSFCYCKLRELRPWIRTLNGNLKYIKYLVENVYQFVQRAVHIIDKYMQESESQIRWCFLQHLISLLCIGPCWFTCVNLYNNQRLLISFVFC